MLFFTSSFPKGKVKFEIKSVVYNPWPKIICPSFEKIHLACFSLFINYYYYYYIILLLEIILPSGPGVKTLPSNAGGVGLILVRGLRAHMPLEDLTFLSPKKQNIKQKQSCNRFNKGFKNGPHQSRKKEREPQQQKNKRKRKNYSPNLISWAFSYFFALWA